MRLAGICSVVFALFQVGCLGAPGDEDLDLGQSSDDLLSFNGVSLNGTSVNGTSVNGTSVNGTSVNGTSVNGTSVNGTSVNGSTLTSASLPGGDFTGTTWIGDLTNGGTIPLRIDGSVAVPAPNADLTSYYVSYQTTAGWSPLCGTEAGGSPIPAIPMLGVWSYAQGVVGGGGYTPDASKITFACRGKAIAKCIEMGYRPPVSGAPSAATSTERLVACTRLLRADYCGDGRSFTVNGTLINLYDNVGIQADAEPWTIEAEWTSTGARCTNDAQFTRLTVSGLTPPECFAAKVSASCGAPGHFHNGTTLMDEFAH
jgi:hypothetical protein